MNEVIKKAIEGGFDFERFRDEQDTGRAAKARIVLDPLFWQSLGKACRWGEHTYYLYCPLCNDVAGDEPRLFTWEYHAFRFHEINLTESFEKAVEYLEDLIK